MIQSLLGYKLWIMMITAHKKNPAQPRISVTTKHIIGLKAINISASASQLSKEYQCSRTTVYAQKNKVLSAVNQAFKTEDNKTLFKIPITKEFIHQTVLGLCLVCQSSYRNIKLFLENIFNYSISIGTVVNIINSACEKANTINSTYDLSAINDSAADEIFHRNKPTLAVVDIPSRYCALLNKANNRDYETWGINLLDLQNQNYSPTTTILDSAKGLIKGHKEVMTETIIRHDHFHIIKDIKDCSRFLQNQEKSSATAVLKLLKKGSALEIEEAVTEHTNFENIRRCFNTLSQWLQFDVLQLAGHPPDKRSMLYDFIVHELKLLASQQHHRINAILTSLKTQRNSLLDVSNTLNEKLEAVSNKYNVPMNIVWRICHALRGSFDSCKYNNEAYELESMLGTKFDEIEDEILIIFETTHRCSSMVENFNSRLRPYLDERKFISQKKLSLVQFYLNHKPFMRSKHERLKDKTPAESMTGKKHKSWLEMLGYTLFDKQRA